jgi:hypothetical protein
MRLAILLLTAMACFGQGSQIDFRTQVKNKTSDQVTYTAPGAGAVARTQASKNQDTVSVKDYGACGDGTCDDTVAIQATINAVEAGGVAGGGTVYVPAGRYKVSSSLNITTGVILRGSASGGAVYAVTIFAATGSGSYPLISVSNGTSPATVRVQDVELNGNGSGTGFLCTGCYGAGVDHVYVTNFAINVDFEIYAGWSEEMYVTHSQITQGITGNIKIGVGTSGVHILNNAIDQGGFGVYVADAAKNIDIQNNDFSGYQYGYLPGTGDHPVAVATSGGQHIYVHQNNFENNSGGGPASSPLAVTCTGGSGYQVGDVIALTQSTTGYWANVTVLTLGGGGALATCYVSNPGFGYTTGAAAGTGGSGSSGAFSISTLTGPPGYSIDTNFDPTAVGVLQHPKQNARHIEITNNSFAPQYNHGVAGSCSTQGPWGNQIQVRLDYVIGVTMDENHFNFSDNPQNQSWPSAGASGGCAATTAGTAYQTAIEYGSFYSFTNISITSTNETDAGFNYPVTGVYAGTAIPARAGAQLPPAAVFGGTSPDVAGSVRIFGAAGDSGIIQIDAANPGRLLLNGGLSGPNGGTSVSGQLTPQVDASQFLGCATCGAGGTPLRWSALIMNLGTGIPKSVSGVIQSLATPGTDYLAPTTVTETCTVAPTGMTIVRGVITAITGGTCTP